MFIRNRKMLFIGVPFKTLDFGVSFCDLFITIFKMKLNTMYRIIQIYFQIIFKCAYFGA